MFFTLSDRHRANANMFLGNTFSVAHLQLRQSYHCSIFFKHLLRRSSQGFLECEGAICFERFDFGVLLLRLGPWD